MSDVGYATLQIIPSAKGFGAALSKEVSPAMSGVGGKEGKSAGGRYRSGILGSLKGIAGPLAAAFAGVQVFSFLKDSVAEAREAQKVGAITVQTIKATGGAAKVTADQVGKLAGAISTKTGIDDEAIQSGANLLLTFKNVRNEVGAGANIFDRATQAAVDLSAAGFGDLNGASKQLGKALNDPIKGIAALTKSGVTFTAQQQAQIKAMVQSGNVLGAQKIILGEVEAQVGGVAEASATMGEKATVAFGNIKETVGTALLPVIDKMGTLFVTKIAPAIQGFIAGMQEGTGAGGRFAGFLHRVAQGAQVVGATLLRLGKQAVSALGPLVGKARELAVKAWPALVAAAQSLAAIFGPLLVELKDAAVAAFPSLVVAAKAVGEALLAAGGQLASFAGVLSAHKTTIQAVTVAVGAMVVAFKAYQVGLAIVATATAVFTAVQEALNLEMSLNPIGIVILALVGLAAGLIYAYKHSEKFRQIVDGAFAAVKTAVIGLIDFFRNLPTSISTAIGNLKALLGPKGSDLIAGMIQGIFNKFIQVNLFFARLALTVLQKIGPLGLTLLGKGTELMLGLLSGIVSRAPSVFLFFLQLPARVLAKLGSLSVTLLKAGATLILGLLKGIGSVQGQIYSAMAKIPGLAARALGNLGGYLVSAGRNFALGFINGIGSMVGAAASKARELASAAKNAITGVLGIHSPSKVMFGYGVNTGEGFANGMAAQVKNVVRASNNLGAAAIPGAGSLPIRSASNAGAVSTSAPTRSAANGRPVDITVLADDPMATARQVGRHLTNLGV